MQYNILSENNTSTVVAHYERPAMVEEDGYQTEADLERSLKPTWSVLLLNNCSAKGMNMHRYAMRMISLPICV